ncbi:MAG TPA: hypothetical protein VN038_27850 [Dyadobacter sp.]|nr:hypothetical protein [Dyadobacter sp.]
MKTFVSLEQAFEWWLKTIYPTIPPSLKEGKYRNAWRDYTYKKGISQKRMREILSDFGNISEKVTVTFNLK